MSSPSTQVKGMKFVCEEMDAIRGETLGARERAEGKRRGERGRRLEREIEVCETGGEQ